MEQITFTLPEGAPTPEYTIGQSVEFKTRYKPEYTPGVIVGMRWMSHNVALEDQSWPGWEYAIEIEPFQGHELMWPFICADNMRPLKVAS